MIKTVEPLFQTNKFFGVHVKPVKESLALQNTFMARSKGRDSTGQKLKFFIQNFFSKVTNPQFHEETPDGKLLSLCSVVSKRPS